MAIDQTMGQTVTVISSMATRNVLADLAERYAQDSRRSVSVESVGGVDAARRVMDGERFDVVALSADAIDRLAAAGRIVAGSQREIARSHVAIAVAAGAAHPDISTGPAVRSAILAARSIGYSTGPSGSHLLRLFERWGISGTIAPRVVQAPPGVPVGSLVASGEVQLGFQQLSELMHLPGVDVVGILPSDLQVVTTFSAAVCVASAQAAQAQAFVSFLASPLAASVKLAHGMEPA